MNRTALLRSGALFRVTQNVVNAQKVLRPTCCACDRLNNNSLLHRISAPIPQNYTTIRQQSTKSAEKTVQEDNPTEEKSVHEVLRDIRADGLFSKKTLKTQVAGKLPNAMLRRRTMVTYTSIIDQVDHAAWMQEFDLPDTFNSWFKITELHVWMMLLRFAPDKDNLGVLLCSNRLVAFMWEDAEKRVKALGRMNYKVKKDSLRMLDEQFRAAIFSYDEGILGDDRMLASALWRSFLNKRMDPDPEHIELLVHYVRKQVHHLFEMDLEETLGHFGFVPILPLHGETLDKNTLHLFNKLSERFDM